MALAAALGAAGCPASGCRYDTDCPGAKVCTGGTCQESPAVAVAAGGRCTPGIPCAAGEVCVSGVCQAQGSQVTQPCTSDQDPKACPSGQLCTVSTQVATCQRPPCAALNACTTPAGRVPGTHACTADGDCATGWCLDGACAAVCATDTDCPDGFACTAETATPPGGVAATVRVCTPKSGTPVLCDGGRFCPGGGACAFDWGPPITTHCVATSSQTVPTGGSCTYYTPCAGNVCLSNNICAAPCLDSQDCPVGMSCGTINFTNGSQATPEPGCIVPMNGCLDNAMCASRPGKTCRLSVSIDNRHLLLACASTGGAPPGASCATGSDCASNLCLPSGVCSQPCLNDGDCRCAGGGSCDGTCATSACTLTGWTCGAVDQPVPAGGTESVRACTPP